MRFLPAAILLLWLCGSACAQPDRGKAGEGIARGSVDERDALELTTSVAEQKYCTGGGMLLTLRLSYKNTGGSNLILFKYALAPYQHLISRSAEAAMAKDYEQVVNPMMGFSSGDTPLGDEPPPSYFVVLKPGEAYSPVNDITLPIFLRKGAEPDCEPGEEGDCENGLQPGVHVLQVKVQTWPFRADPVAELHMRWQRFGDIWAKPLLSLSMPFQVGTAPHITLSNCNTP